MCVAPVEREKRLRDDSVLGEWAGVLMSIDVWKFVGGVFRTRTDEADWFRHIFREHNTVDMHANWLMDNGDSGAGAQWEKPGLCDAIFVVDVEGAQNNNLKFYQTLSGCVICFENDSQEVQ